MSTSLSEYADSEPYDPENQDFEPDGPFLLDMAKQSNGPVLEVGCGTGRVAPLVLRYTFPQEVETLLYYNGFEIAEQYGDWARSDLSEKSRMIINVCKRRG